MSRTLLQKTIKFVDTAFGDRIETQRPHLEQTVYWMKKFYPTYEEAHLIAAYAHDIERSLQSNNVIIPEDYTNIEFLKNHQETGAKMMAEFLLQENAPESLINKVQELISKHEVGGSVEQTALMDADSVSFLETNSERFVTNLSFG